VCICRESKRTFVHAFSPISTLYSVSHQTERIGAFRCARVYGYEEDQDCDVLDV